MVKNALLINPFGIGDVLFTTPIIHTLKDAYPGIRLGYLCNRRVHPILENNPHVDFVFVYERDEFEAARKKSYLGWIKKSLAFLNQIKAKRFDLAIDFSLNSQYGFFSWYAGIKRRVGYDYKGRGWLLNKKIKLDGYNEKHIVEYYAGLLKLIGLELKYKNLELYLNQKDIDWANEFLAKNSVTAQDLLIAIIPGAGASWGKDATLKHWPAENFSGLCDKIIENYRAKIIIMGDFSEKPIAQKILQNIHCHIIDATAETTLGQFAALLKKTKLVVTNDGGPMHMAVALGIKTISIFGPVDSRVYGPYPPSEESVVVKKGLDCQPCYRRFKMPLCVRNRECLATLSVDEVYAQVRRLLG